MNIFCTYALDIQFMLYFSLIIHTLYFPKLYLDLKIIGQLFFLNAFKNHIPDHISPITWILHFNIWISIMSDSLLVNYIRVYILHNQKQKSKNKNQKSNIKQKYLINVINDD